MASALNVAPADLTQLRRRDNGTFPMEKIEAMLISTREVAGPHGYEQMPVWGAFFVAVDGTLRSARARVANLTAYLESMQR